MMRRHLVPLVVALPLLLTSASASGFELLRVNNDPCARDQPNLFWPSASAAVSTASLPLALQAVASEGRSRWNSSVRGFTFRGGIGASCNASDGVTAIVFSDVACDGSSLGDVLGITRSVWNSRGELLDADVVLNESRAVVHAESVFLEVVMHELGHVLGLDHSDACERSGAGTLMNSTLFLGIPRLEFPQADDIEGAEFIYPSSGSGGVPEGANSCNITPASGGRLPALPFLCVPAFLVLRRWLCREALRPGRVR